MFSCFSITVLDKLVSKLDRRLDQKMRTKRGFKHKLRVLKSPSKLQPPQNAPSWAVVSKKSGECATTEVTPTSSNTTKRSTSFSRRKLDLEEILAENSSDPDSDVSYDIL